MTRLERAPWLALVLVALWRAPVARDLDVAVPPGSPLEWTAAFPAYTPPRRPLFPRTGPAENPAQKPGEASGEEPQRTASSARSTSSAADVRISNAFGQVRILTWDLTAHLEWTKKPLPQPTTGHGALRPPAPEFGDPLYWLSLAPLLRLLLHPDSLSRSETLAHLVELGEPVLPVLGAAAQERDLAVACRDLRALIRPDAGVLPTPPPGATPRESAFARFVLEECLRDRPLDPSDDFGRRLFLFAEEAEPLLCRYAEHPALELSRNAVAALGRYETRSAVQFLAAFAARAEDPVALVRALAALGRYRGALDVAPLLARLERTSEPVQRAALIGALGRLGARAAAPLLLRLGEDARRAKDSDLLISVLSALARIAWLQPQPELASFCARVSGEARELGRRSELTLKPDLPDPPELRATILSQLALLARTQAAAPDEKTRAELVALARPAPLDARLSELGRGGTDPLGSIPAAVRFLYLEGLVRAGPGGLELLASLARRPEVETALRARALALLSYDQRGALAVTLLEAAETPLELCVQALEVLITDVHPRAPEFCRRQLARPGLGDPRPDAALAFLVQRAVRFLSEAGKLGARDLLPLQALVQHPPSERAGRVAELRARLRELAEFARAGGRAKELGERAGALVDYVIEHRLNALLDPAARAARSDALLQALEPLRAARTPPEAVAQLVPALQALLLGGEVELEDPGRALFQPLVPLAEEVLLALGRSRDPLAVELVLAALQGGARELRAHACLALGMCAQPDLAPKLLPALLDEDPFVRFAAAEALRHLTGREHAVDWLAAPAAERQTAAEELRLWLLTRER